MKNEPTRSTPTELRRIRRLFFVSLSLSLFLFRQHVDVIWFLFVCFPNNFLSLGDLKKTNKTKTKLHPEEKERKTMSFGANKRLLFEPLKLNLCFWSDSVELNKTTRAICWFKFSNSHWQIELPGCSFFFEWPYLKDEMSMNWKCVFL